MERHRPVRRWTSKGFRMLVLIIGLLALSVACGSSATVTPTSVFIETPPGNLVGTPESTSASAATAAPAPNETLSTGPMVRVEDLVFQVELADSADKRIRGLSGRASLAAGTGMLFIFEKPERFRFWMREMEIPLDIVWIGSNCEVVDVSEDVPFPDPETQLEDLPRYSPESRAKFVLEINGGEAADLGLGIGDKVEFLNEIAGKYAC